MKIHLLLLLLLLALTSIAAAQKAEPLSDIYQFGTRAVRIPAPDAFVEIGSEFPHVTARLHATEDPKNEALAVHVPVSFIPKLKISEAIDLEFYTKVSVNRQIKAMDITAADYSAVIATLQREFGDYIDTKGSVMKGVESNSEKGLTDVYGRPTKVNINGVTNLGFFERSNNVFSGMLVVNIEVGGRKMSTLGTLSVLYVKQRIIFAYAYKMSPTDTDAAMMSDFTKKWTAKIIAANK